MNTAACLVSEPVVLSPESVVLPTAENSSADSPLLRAEVSCKVPSDRDLQIYEVVVFAGRSQRDVAREFGVSQPRVNQILKELAAWMADNTPNFCSGLTPEQKLRLVHYQVVQQLEYQRCALMEAWEESRKGIETVSRTSIVGNVRQTTEYQRPRSGKASFMNAAARVSLAIAKLAGWTPQVVVPDAPQDSPWWQMEEERGLRVEEESGVGDQESEEGEAEESRLSPWEEQAQDPNLTREEMDAITAEQEAICAALEAKIQRLETALTQSQNTLSLGTGPLLPEANEASVHRPKSNGSASHVHNMAERLSLRQAFLRDEPPVMSIQDFVGQKK